MRFLGQYQFGYYDKIENTEDDCEGLSVEQIEQLYGTEGSARSKTHRSTGAGYLEDEDSSGEGSAWDEDEEVEAWAGIDRENYYGDGLEMGKDEDESEDESEGEGEDESKGEGEDESEEWLGITEEGKDSNGSPEEDDMEDSGEEETIAHNHVDPNIRHPAIPVPQAGNPLTDEEINIFKDIMHAYESERFVPQGYGMCPEEWKDRTYPAVHIIPVGRRMNKELKVELPDGIWHPRSEKWVRALFILNYVKRSRD